jgi:hypothetical protein
VRLLVYVPCWINYEAGLAQIQRLRSQEAALRSSGVNFELEVVVSINAIDSIPKALEERLNSVAKKSRHFKTNLGDVNIGLGFLDAIQSEADLFWIVSPKNTVSETALSRIIDFFGDSLELDFVVADEDERGVRNITLEIDQLHFQVMSEASFGMVTGVVYRLAPFRPYLHLGVQAAFTGWGQLAVLLGGSRRKEGVTGRVLPSDYFYFRGGAKVLSHDDKLENFRTYAHGFFGFVIIMSLLLPKPKSQVRLWVFANWFRIGAYTKAYSTEKYGYVRLTDLRHLAKVVVAETGFFTRTLYSFACRLDFGQLKKKFRRGRG